jgi:hypothetical protein
MSTAFAEERLVQRDAGGHGVDLYERSKRKLYRCRYCHVGFSPDDKRSLEKAQAHVSTCTGAQRK